MINENNFEDKITAAIDEVGRGPLAGPVLASCVLIKDKSFLSQISDIRDSKKLSKKQRQKFLTKIYQIFDFGVGIVWQNEIDEINILKATKKAMYLSYQDLKSKLVKEGKKMPEIILVDGNFIPFACQDNINQIIPIIKGDEKVTSIAAASIIAKEIRDEIMIKIDHQFPVYNFKKNMGYPTKKHIEAVKKFGICFYHRKSFAPIKSLFLKN